MSIEDSIADVAKYSLALVLPESRKLLAIEDPDGYHLPSVAIPLWTRPAEELQKLVRDSWGIPVIILDFLRSTDCSQVCVVAEVLVLNDESALKAIDVKWLSDSSLDERQRERLLSKLAGNSGGDSPFTALGWIEQAILWLESVVGKNVSKSAIKQYNAGGGFTLVRFRTQDDRDYWLKATGEPNAHEASITILLSKLCESYLPQVISTKLSWNAWLMSGEATACSELPDDSYQLLLLLENAVESMARLQMQTQGHALILLNAGAIDHGVQIFRRRSDELFDYLEEAMSLQISTKVRRIEKKRLLKMRSIFELTCDSVESLDIGASIVHGDLNPGNILTGNKHCQFIDWCEAYLGSPLISLQHLLLLNKVSNAEVRDFINGLLKNRYLEAWSASCDPNVLLEGFIYMPMLALASTLYGRGDWLHSTLRNDPRRQSYARSLARYMDRASREPEFVEALCL